MIECVRVRVRVHVRRRVRGPFRWEVGVRHRGSVDVRVHVRVVALSLSTPT